MMVSIHKKLVQGMSVSLDDKAEATATSEFSPVTEEEIKAKEEKTKAEEEKTKTERAYIEEKTGLSIEEFLSIKNIEELDKFLGKGNFEDCVFRDFDKHPKYLQFGTDKNLNLFKMALIIKLTKLKSRID